MNTKIWEGTSDFSYAQVSRRILLFDLIEKDMPFYCVAANCTNKACLKDGMRKNEEKYELILYPQSVCLCRQARLRLYARIILDRRITRCDSFRCWRSASQSYIKDWRWFALFWWFNLYFGFMGPLLKITVNNINILLFRLRPEKHWNTQEN